MYRASLGFSEAADFASTQEFELTERQLGGEPVQLKCACSGLRCSRPRCIPHICEHIPAVVKPLMESPNGAWFRYVKFQAVNHLSIFIEDNQGDEEVTRVGKIQLLGAAGQTMNVAEIKKVEEGQ